MLDFIRRIFFRKQIRKLVTKKVSRVPKYIRAFLPDEHLPLDGWTFLVKDRAGFRCEDCDRTENLVSHHFSPEEKAKGIHILKHGKCLCAWCHVNRYTKLSDPYRRSFYNVYGFYKGKELYTEFTRAKTRIEKKAFIEKLSSYGTVSAHNALNPYHQI